MSERVAGKVPFGLAAKALTSSPPKPAGPPTNLATAPASHFPSTPKVV